MITLTQGDTVITTVAGLTRVVTTGDVTTVATSDTVMTVAVSNTVVVVVRTSQQTCVTIDTTDHASPPTCVKRSKGVAPPGVGGLLTYAITSTANDTLGQSVSVQPSARRDSRTISSHLVKSQGMTAK